MDWNTLKAEVYYEDGSLRDIVILDTSVEDWKKWIQLVNQQYKISFYNGQTQQLEEQIDFDAVNAYLTRKIDWASNATITINTFEINCHFFDPNELENDIHPEEFQSAEDHNQLMEYLAAVSKHLNKKVFLTDENYHSSVLIEVG